MGIRSYVRDRKQVKASRAGEGTEKLSRGDFSHFGGQNGASVSFWDTHPGQNEGPQPANQRHLQPKSKREAGAPDYHPQDKGTMWHDDTHDMYGRSGAMKDAEKYVSKAGDTPEAEASRGARMKVSETVTVLGQNWDKNHGRAVIDSDTRARGESIKKKNAAEGGSSIPTRAAVDKENDKKKPISSWDDWA